MLNLFSQNSRRNARKAAAKAAGYSFHTRLKNTGIRFGDFSLFQSSGSKEPVPSLSREATVLKNVWENDRNGMHILQFDYKAESPGGTGEASKNYSVVHFKVDGLNLPAFQLTQEDFFDQIGEFLGGDFQDIDFDDTPIFSSKYLLRGTDETAIRTLFTPQIRKTLEKLKGAHLEASGDEFLYYEERLIGNNEPELFIRLGERLLGMFG